jgi:hypothetical protein
MGIQMAESTRTHESIDKNLINETVAAERLAVKVSTLRHWRWAGKGPRFIKIGAAVRYSPSDLEQFVGRGRREPEAKSKNNNAEQNET